MTKPVSNVPIGDYYFDDNFRIIVEDGQKVEWKFIIYYLLRIICNLLFHSNFMTQFI